MLDFETTVKTRQSIRKFLPTEMTEAEIKQILADAQNAPSACNPQPWLVHIASGETLQRLHKIIIRQHKAQLFTLRLNIGFFQRQANHRNHNILNIAYRAGPFTMLD